MVHRRWSFAADPAMFASNALVTEKFGHIALHNSAQPLTFLNRRPDTLGNADLPS